jgi:hypothetical protein
MLEMEICPNGERITRTEKMVGISLADYHQGGGTYPSIESIAAVALVDRRTCQRLLGSLERKGVILRVRPTNQGRGASIFYYFRELDVLPEGRQDAALSTSSATGSLFAQKGGKRAAEGRQKGGIQCSTSLYNREQEQQEQQVQKQTPPNPLVAEGEGGEEELANDGKTEEGTTHLEGAQEQPQKFVPAPVRVVSSPRDGFAPAPEAGDRAGAESDSLLRSDCAVDQVMQGCGFTAHRLRPVLAAVIQQQADKGEPPPTTALAMIAAWRSYILQGEKLRCKWGARRFFAEGYWRESESWPWDAVVLREQHVRAQASVGSYQ